MLGRGSPLGMSSGMCRRGIRLDRCSCDDLASHGCWSACCRWGVHGHWCARGVLLLFWRHIAVKRLSKSSRMDEGFWGRRAQTDESRWTRRRKCRARCSGQWRRGEAEYESFVIEKDVPTQPLAPKAFSKIGFESPPHKEEVCQE